MLAFTLAVLACAFAAAPAPAPAHKTSTGGASAPMRPQVAEVICGGEATGTCAEGQILKLKGENLETARAVVFLGARGPRDDRRVIPTARSPHRVLLRVPEAAPSGRIRVLSRLAGASAAGPKVLIVAPAIETLSTEAAPIALPTAFPVEGRYDFGTATNHFGGGRGHEGQDIFAACGTPVVAALAGTVTLARWHDAAGNYVVIKASDGTSQAYMHLKRAASVRKGQAVAAGRRIGAVGATGRAHGCHLHLELWTAPGWYEGGKAIDALPSLRGWAKASGARRK
jgi:murein DD-endopeptidase MepM/ murein hydrolase activator NlpD